MKGGKGDRAEHRATWPDQLSAIEAKLRNPATGNSERAAAAMTLIRLGAPRLARLALKGVAGTAAETVARFAADLEAGDAVLRQVTGTEPFAEGDIVREARSTGTMLAVRPGATRVFLIFTGTTREFAIPEPLIADRTAHLLCARDLTRCFYLLGMARLGASYAACLAAMRGVAEALAPAQVFCIGTSAGGYAALRYGLDLAVPAVLAFSAPSTLDLRSEPGATIEDYPQLEHLYEKGRSMAIDLRPLYRDAPAAPRLLLSYCTGQKRDRLMSERMGGLPGVELLPVPAEVGHAVFPWMNQSGRMAEMLERLVQ